jgi:uncharacterized MAPEG superfamily protein
MADLSPTAATLLGLVAVHLVLATVMVSHRGLAVLGGKRAVNGFTPHGEDLSPFAARLARVHANGYENMAAVAAVLLYAIATDQTAITDPLALLLLGAKIGQGSVHLISKNVPAVWIRFSFYGMQLTIVAWWLAQFLGLAR